MGILWSDGGVFSSKRLVSEPDVGVVLEVIVDLGARWTAGLRAKVTCVLGLRLEEYFTICFKPFDILLSASPPSIQSGFGPKP